MRRSRIAFGGIIVVALIGWLLFSSSLLQQQQSNTPALTAQEGAGPTAPAASPASAPTERSTLADALNAPTSTIQADLRLVSEIIDTFRTNFPHSGNPTGTNADITAALAGRNRLKLALIPPDHPAINRDGELLDRWGTPFFFHSESAARTELRSAGPDKKLWTEDDVAFAP